MMPVSAYEVLMHREVCREREGIFCQAGISIDSDGCGDTKYTPFLPSRVLVRSGRSTGVIGVL